MPANPWEAKYREMPLDELRAYLAKWEEITADAEALPTGSEDCRAHVRACRQNLRLVRRIARERGLTAP
jgi:hypothetical protein